MGETPPAPTALYFSGVGVGGCFGGLVSPCPLSTHQKICLTRARKPNRAIKYYLDAMRSRLASLSSLQDAQLERVRMLYSY